MLELILVFPILFILLLAVIEFGLIYAATQYVSHASRFGAKLASEEPTAGLEDFNLSSGGSRLRTQIDNYLQTVEMGTGACRVILQHNVLGVSNPLQEDTSAMPCDCDPPVANLPTLEEYVRVTVCVPLEGNVPDLLATFGFSIQDRIIEESTTFHYEN